MANDNHIPINYLPLEAPLPALENRAVTWSTSQAKTFFHWLIENHQSRVHNLLTFFGKELPECSGEWEEFLRGLGSIYAEQLQRPEFSVPREGKPALTPAGRSLAFDANLLVAFLLIRYPRSHACWHLLLDPGAFSHNHPVLRGFASNQYLDPFAGIYEAHALLVGKKSPDLLRNIFAFWKGRMI